MNISQENYIVKLCDAADSTDDWLSIIHFGFSTLLERQSLLAELITRRAQKVADRGPKSRKPSDEVAPILRLLNLKLVVTPTETTQP